MGVLENIERITVPSREVFEREYMWKKRPVILTNLFEGQPVKDISTMEDVRALMGHVELELQNEYISDFLAQLNRQLEKGGGINAVPGETMKRTLNEYLDYVRANPDTKLRCAENTTPPELRARFKIPDFCRQGEDGMEDNLSHFFLANRGNASHLHFDGDHRHVILYQLAGYKRYMAIPPENAKKLNPIGNQGVFFIENFSESEKESFVRYTGGCDCVLSPGEALYVPPLMWHYAEYNTTSISFTLRFRRNKYGVYLAKMFQDMYVQNVGWRMIDEAEVERKYLPVVREIEEAYDRAYGSRFEKYKAMQELFQGLYARVCTDSLQGLYSWTNFEALCDGLAKFDTEYGKLYKN